MQVKATRRYHLTPVRISSVQLLGHVWLFATPWTGARQASLSITNSWTLLKLISIESVMPFNHLILCCPLLLLPSIFPSIRVFSNESAVCIRWPNYWCFITLWQIDREIVRDFIFLGSKITADSDCSREIKRHLLLGRKAMTNLDSLLKSRGIILPTKVHTVKAMVFQQSCTAVRVGP